MRTVSEGHSSRRYLWLWLAVFVVLTTLVLVTALLPWTKTEPGATLTSPAASAVDDGAYAPAARAAEDEAPAPAPRSSTVDDGAYGPAAKAAEDEASAPAPRSSTVEEGASAPAAKAAEDEAPAPVLPPTTVEGGSLALAPSATEDAASVPPPAPNALEKGAVATPAPNGVGGTASAPPPAPNAVENGASAPAPAPDIDQRGLLAALLRHGSRPEGLTPADYPGVDVLLATPLYFSFTGRQVLAVDRPSIVFFVSEEVHIGELPALPPRPFLKTGRIYHEPVEVRMLTDSPHHRTSIVRYNAAWSDGSPFITPEARSLELVFPASGASEASVLSWELPIPYGPGYSSREVSIAGAARTSAAGAAGNAGHTHESASGAFGKAPGQPYPVSPIGRLLL